MLSEQSIIAIKKNTEKLLLQECAFYNNEIDHSKLLEAISKAIAEAIRQYDRLR